MPVTPSSARRTSKSRYVEKESPTAITSDVESSTFHQAALVQDRVRQWQDQGAAYAPAPDALSVRSSPLSDVEPDWSQPQTRRTDAPSSAPPKKNTRRLDKHGSAETQELRSSSTPRRRLFSDEHWKSTRDDKERRSSTTRPKLEKPAKQSDSSYPSNRKPDHNERSDRRRSKTKSFQKEIIAQESSGIPKGRVDTWPDNNLHEDLRTDVGQNAGSCMNDDSFSHFADPSIDCEELNTYDDDILRPDEDDGRSRRESRYAQTLGRQTGDSESSLKVPKSKRTGVLSRTKEMFSKSEGIAVMSNRLPSIEAWLDEQPDPFGEDDIEHDLLEVEVPAPLKPHSKPQKGLSREKLPTDANDTSQSRKINKLSDSPSYDRRKSWEHHMKAQVVGTLSHDRNSAKTLVDRETERDDVEASPTSLRRRGARSRRRQHSSPRKSEETGLSSENPGTRQSIETLSHENKYKILPPGSFPPTGLNQSPTMESIDRFRKGLDSREYESSQIMVSGLKRKVTTHEDLMSVLSAPRQKKSSRSTRIIKKSHTQKDESSAQEVLAGLIADEEKYTRELRTLVDGVIPVLLQCVLSKSDSIAAAGLFTSSANASDDMSFTRPIIDMGIALERLKSLHGRLPAHNVDSLLTWAQTAQRAYTDYLKAWRLGFQDVVVNLAPIDEKRSEIDNGMARDGDGDVIDAEGKKADVAYLLKRPLVRVKNLGKTFETIKIQSEKPLAIEVAQAYADLTALAKHRHQEEQARLEDEAAANIDSTRSRDIRTMAAISGVHIEKGGRVKARDCFNLTLYHSTGQRMDCRIEIIIRDHSQSNSRPGGDLLICEIDATGKWLLFAPVRLETVSARRGDSEFDLVIMIRGRAGLTSEWHELMALKTDDQAAVTEWLSMLGSAPLPPKLSRMPSFGKDKVGHNEGKAFENSQGDYSGQHGMLLNSPEIDIPIGEPSIIGSKSGLGQKPEISGTGNNKPLPRLNLGGGLQRKPVPTYQQNSEVSSRRTENSVHSSDRSTISDKSINTTSSILRCSPIPISPGRQSIAKSPHQDISDQHTRQSHVESMRRQYEESTPRADGPGKLMNKKIAQEETTSNSRTKRPDLQRSDGMSSSNPVELMSTAKRPPIQRLVSSTPSKDLPTVTKVRTASNGRPQDSSTPLSDSIRDQWNALSGSGLAGSSKAKTSKPLRSQIYTEDVPAPPTHSARHSLPRKPVPLQNESPPPTPPHRDFSNLQQRSQSAPSTAIKAGPTPQLDIGTKRRSSSPLKREYAPSTASESSPQSDTDSSSDSSSETSDDLGSEDEDVATPLVAVLQAKRRTLKPNKKALPSVPSTGTRTLAPSDSASQGPYRQVPSSATIPSSQKKWTIALVCSWSQKGIWEQIHPDECSIVISPGLIEAFEMSAAHANNDHMREDQQSAEERERSASHTERPLVAFELTPIVPLRRGTALDISIRSRPTASSKLSSTNNVMFRSRNAEECEALYGMINWARCNNPTYIQLEKARPARQPTVSFNLGTTQLADEKTNSWFKFGGSQRKSHYRASSAPIPGLPSIGGNSDASAGSTTSAFSVLKHFGANSAFNLNRSSVMKRSHPTRANGSLYSSSSGTGTGSLSSTPPPSQLGLIPDKDGPNVPSTSAAAAEGGGMINNMKIRLYVRKGQHWENLGAARLHVLPVETPPTPSRNASSEPNNPNMPNNHVSSPIRTSEAKSPTHKTPDMQVIGQPGTNRGPRLSSSNYTPHRIHGNGREKRIMITRNKDPHSTLLDAVLGESCFERVMQTGIAVKVWTEEDKIGDTGGVILGKEKIYMMQFPGTREAGWVFGLCGTYRYSAE